MTRKISFEVALSRSQVGNLPPIPIGAVHEIYGRVEGRPGIVVGRGDRGRLVRALFWPRDGWEQVDGGWMHRDNPGQLVSHEWHAANLWAASAPELRWETEQ